MVFNVFHYMFRHLHHNQVYEITGMTVISAIEIAVVINVPQTFYDLIQLMIAKRQEHVLYTIKPI